MVGLIPTHAGKTRPARNQPGHAWAHPRSRGENRTVTLYARGDLGSSPLTRGKRLSEPGARHLQGLIPTHAGKTRGPTSYPFPGWAHPRSRGENMGSLFLQRHMVGSSPLTRGKRKPRAPLLHRDGLIPTHAGKMTGTWPPPCPSPAHPHSRRENAPPRFKEDRVPGLIPAHAGKTNARRGMKYRGAAHPRSRGENQSRVRRHTPPPGSSPLTRGKQSEGTGAFTHHGLIPAHAGKTLTDKHPVRTVTAHPRSRGENVMCFFAPSAVQGSSPLTRGKLSLLGVVLRSVGLIPAHAGKTLITSSANSTVRAHPRSRGEN